MRPRPNPATNSKRAHKNKRTMSGYCRAIIFNITGQEVMRLVDEEVRAGRHGLVCYGPKEKK